MTLEIKRLEPYEVTYNLNRMNHTVDTDGCVLDVDGHKVDIAQLLPQGTIVSAVRDDSRCEVYAAQVLLEVGA